MVAILKKKTSMTKIQKLFEQISNIPSRGWREWKNWFFILFLVRGIFLIHQIQKKVKKRPESKNFCMQKSFMSCPSTMRMNFFDIYIILKVFCRRVVLPPLFCFWKKKISNLKFISFLIHIFRKWVRQLEIQKTGLL